MLGFSASITHDLREIVIFGCQCMFGLGDTDFDLDV